MFLEPTGRPAGLPDWPLVNLAIDPSTFGKSVVKSIGRCYQSVRILSNKLFNVVASWECAETVGLFDPSWHSKEKTWIGV